MAVRWKRTEHKPYVSNNLHLMMPLKMLKDKMKCTYIEYVNGSIVIKRNEGVARLVLDSQDAELDGKDVKIADAPIKKDDETFVPIEYIADTLDYTCEYNYDTGRVSLDKVGEDSKLPAAYDMRKEAGSQRSETRETREHAGHLRRWLRLRQLLCRMKSCSSLWIT